MRFDDYGLSREEFQEFKDKRDKAVEQGKKQFEFQGKEILVGYAKYLIEHLGGMLEKEENGK